MDFHENLHEGRAHCTEHFCFLHRLSISYSFHDMTLRITKFPNFGYIIYKECAITPTCVNQIS